MTAILSFIILTAYCIYAGIDKSLSATYYKVSKPYLFQVALGLGGFLMMLNLLEMTAGKWYQFLSFFATSALIFVAFAPDYKQMMEGKVHVAAAMTSAITALALIVLMGYWYVPILPALTAFFLIKKFGNKTYWLEMVCFASIFITALIKSIWY